jgi:histidinol-phosphate phosphatase family protein
MQAVILAGGRGTRLAAGGDDGCDAPPKPLTSVNGLTMLEHVIGRLAPQGIDDFVLLTGYRAAEIERALGDGARFGVRLRYQVEPTPLGTAGATRAARALLDERFVVAYGDVLADVDVSAMLQAHLASGAEVTLAVHPNDHPFDSDRVVTDRTGRVLKLVRREDHAGPEAGALCNAAFYVVEKRALELVSEGAPDDFARDLFPRLVAAGRALHAYRTVEYLKDMGTAERLRRVEADVREGVPERSRRGTLKPALVCDRDGVLIEDRPYIARAEDIALLPGVTQALSRLNRAHVLAVCCTNQPVVARGAIDEEGLHALHTRLEGLLGAEGAWLDGIFVCPHHPDRGFAGERADLKIACACRKPQPGLLHQARAELGMDARTSVVVGDRTADLLAARAAGMLGVGVLTGAACHDGKYPLPPETPLVPSLAEAAALLLDTAPSWRPWIDRVRAAGVVAIGGPSRAGKTLAAVALRLALAQDGVTSLHVSLDRFIRPRSERRAGAGVEENTRFDEAARAARSLAAGRAVLTPGYHPVSRERAPGEALTWDRRGVLILDGVLACGLELDGALHVALDDDPAARAERRRDFYLWKGLAGAELESAVHGRAEEEARVAALAGRAAIRLRLDGSLRLWEAP